MISKDDIARRFGHSASTYDSASSAQRVAAEKLASQLAQRSAVGGNLFEVGCGTGALTKLLFPLLKPHIYIANDISSEMLSQLYSSASDNTLSTLLGDAENLAWPSDMDIITSASAVQWFDNPLSFPAKAFNALRPGGTMGIATYGPQTFCELQSLGVPGLHYPTLSEWDSAIANAGMRLLHSEASTLVLHYPSALDLMHDLQLAGVTSSTHVMSAPSLRNLLRRYDELYLTDNKVPLTYEIYILVAQK